MVSFSKEHRIEKEWARLAPKLTECSNCGKMPDTSFELGKFIFPGLKCDCYWFPGDPRELPDRWCGDKEDPKRELIDSDRWCVLRAKVEFYVVSTFLVNIQ